MFFQLPTPIPVQPNPTIPGGGNYPYGGGGSYLNPDSYARLAQTLGPAWFVLLVFTVLLFLALAYMVWRQMKQPSNAKQMHILGGLWRDSQERNRRLRSVLRQFCEVVLVFAESSKLDVKMRIEKIQDALDETPPTIPPELKITDEGAE